MSTLLRGVALEDPALLEDESDGEQVSVLLFGDSQFDRYRDQELEIEELLSCEVVFRGETAARVKREIRKGDRVLIAGELRITAPLDWSDDRQLVSVRVEAYSVGVDLAHPRP